MSEINVNLGRCTYAEGIESGAYHFSELCDTRPVLIPCRIPGSVTFEVRQGECTCLPGFYAAAQTRNDHLPRCLGKPIRVSCSIGGKTWAESEVTDVEKQGEINAYQFPTELERTLALAACRERWALVKALVTGFTGDIAAFAPGSAMAVRLRNERDVMFAALAAKIRAEQADDATTRDLMKILPGLAASDVTEAMGRDYLSTRALERYVKDLIAQIGGMP